jgi:Ca-activated chloride channel family protein
VLRYTAVGETIEQRTTTIPIVANVVSAAEAANDVPDADVREEVLVLRAARVRDEAIRLADEGEIDFALAAVESTARDLEAAGLVDDAADLRTARTALHSYDAMSRKLLNQQSWDRKRGRGRPRPGRE